MPVDPSAFARSLYEHFPDPVIVVDADRVILGVNAAARQQFGFTDLDLVSRPVRLIYASDDDYDRCLNKSDAADPAAAATPAVYGFRRKDGTVFSARLRKAAVPVPESGKHGFIGIVHDISDFIELNRREARSTLRMALEAIPDGIAIFDSDERLIAFNEGYRRVCGPAGPHLKPGISAEAIIRMAYEQGHYPDAPPGSLQAEQWLQARMYDFRNPPGIAKVFPFDDGRWLRVENVKTKDGNIVAIRIDVTDLKRTEMALDRQRLEYVTLVQNIPDFITRISADKRYTFVNDHYARFVGLPAQELIGKPFLEFVPLPDRARVNSTLDGLTSDAPMVTAEQCRILDDGSELWILWSNIAVFDNDLPVEFVTVGRNISKIKQHEQRIARQSAELKRKNDALDQFTGTVSHDLKAPLRHISMFSEMISSDINSGHLEDVPVYAKHLHDSARRMDQLIESLLDYAQIAYQINPVGKVDLTRIFQDCLVDLGSQIEDAGAHVLIEPLPSIYGDGELLKRLAQNLVGNALKYRKRDQSAVVRVFHRNTSDAVEICVEDNGIGIDPRFATRIFDVFQRLHRDESVYSGTGIGLALAKRITESHNGTIALDTTYRDGARFVMTFPAETALPR